LYYVSVINEVYILCSITHDHVGRSKKYVSLTWNELTINAAKVKLYNLHGIWYIGVCQIMKFPEHQHKPKYTVYMVFSQL